MSSIKLFNFHSKFKNSLLLRNIKNIELFSSLTPDKHCEFCKATIQFPNRFSDFDLIKNSLLSLPVCDGTGLKREITFVKSENQFSLGIFILFT